MPKQNIEKIVYRWRVRIGFLGLVLTVILADPNLLYLLTGLGICILGLLLRAWASGYLRKEKELTISGPYQYSRNPLYLGNLIIGISTVIASRSIWVLAIFATYFLLFYPIVIQRENERMRRLFPDEYKEYKKKVPLFFPSMKSSPSSGKKNFRWRLYRKNKEWRALLGAVVFWLTLTIKMILF